MQHHVQRSWLDQSQLYGDGLEWFSTNYLRGKGSFLRSFIQAMSFKLTLVWELKVNKKKRRQRHPAPPIDTSRGDPRFVPTSKKNERKRLGQLTSSDSVLLLFASVDFPTNFAIAARTSFPFHLECLFRWKSRPDNETNEEKAHRCVDHKDTTTWSGARAITTKSGVGRWDGPLESAMRRN